MPNRKNQHFVPRVYLRSFASNENCIELFIKSNGSFVTDASISGQASRPYFYGKDPEIEERFGYFETEYGRVLEKINSDLNSLSKEDINFLAMFLFLQWGRTEAAASELTSTGNSLNQYVSEKFPEADKSDLEAATTFQKNLECSLSLAVEMYEICRDLSYKFLINETSVDFISSDSPVSLYNQFHERIGRQTFAFGTIGTQIFFPITPKIMFVLYDSLCYKIGTRKSTSIRLTQSADIHTLNKITYINSNKVIYFRNRATIGSFNSVANISRNCSKHEIIQTSDNAGIFHTVNQPPLCKAKLSFIKESDRAKAVKQLPVWHESLLRKYVIDRKNGFH